MKKLLIQLYLWYVDPMDTCCRPNYIFDEYSFEAAEIVNRPNEIQEIFYEQFNEFIDKKTYEGIKFILHI